MKLGLSYSIAHMKLGSGKICVKISIFNYIVGRLLHTISLFLHTLIFCINYRFFYDHQQKYISSAWNIKSNVYSIRYDVNSNCKYRF